MEVSKVNELRQEAQELLDDLEGLISEIIQISEVGWRIFYLDLFFDQMIREREKIKWLLREMNNAHL